MALVSNIYRPPSNINSNLTHLIQQIERYIDLYVNLQANLSNLKKNSFILADVYRCFEISRTK